MGDQLKRFFPSFWMQRFVRPRRVFKYFSIGQIRKKSESFNVGPKWLFLNWISQGNRNYVWLSAIMGYWYSISFPHCFLEVLYSKFYIWWKNRDISHLRNLDGALTPKRMIFQRGASLLLLSWKKRVIRSQVIIENYIYTKEGSISDFWSSFSVDLPPCMNNFSKIMHW